jgi:uncharacterized cupredoxin-like copper-binding protein
VVRFNILVFFGLAFSALAVIACGGGKSNSGSSAASASPTATTAVPTAAPVAQIINVMDVEAGDKYSFDPSSIQVKAGLITIHYSNPAGSARNHTFELKTIDGSADVFKSDQIEPGKTVDFQFTVTAPGTYQYLCYQRGHADRGQTGTLTVTGPTG